MERGHFQVSPMMILLFGAIDLDIQHTTGRVHADQMIELSLNAKTAVLLKAIRKELDADLKMKIENPAVKLGEVTNNLVTMVLSLLEV